jgi:taurine dioxygenase
VDLKTTPLQGGLGAEVAGYDFASPRCHDTVETLRRALVEHHLLLFRGRTLDPATQIAFTLIFGNVLQTCSPRTRYLPEFPAILRVANRPENGNLNIGSYWHSDGAYLTDPTAISIHHIIVPSADGDTLYTSLAGAYDRLSSGERSEIAPLWTRSQTGVVHPLVRAHPVTGRPGLYVNLDPAAAVIDAFGRARGDIQDFIARHLNREGSFYRHHWRMGDLVVVDNFAAAHQATGADVAAPRVLHRTSVHGPAAWWRSDQRR